MGSSHDSECTPLLDHTSPDPNRTHFPDTNHLKNALSAFANALRFCSKAFDQPERLTIFFSLVCAALAVLVFSNFVRKEPVYFPLSPPPFMAYQPELQAGGDRGVSIRFLTMNTFIRPVLVGIGDYKDERLADLVLELGRYDIVCLQELFWATGSRKKIFMDAASEHGLKYQTSSPMLGLEGIFRFPPKIIDAGLSILSRYPIAKADYHTFSQAVYRSIDIIVAKGVLYSRIRLFVGKPARYAHIFTTHMQADNNLKGPPFVKVRATQILELVAFIKDMIADDPNGVVIICGDMNVNAIADNENSSSKEYIEAYALLRSFRPTAELQDLLFKANNGSHPVTSAGGLTGVSKKKECLDYIFLSSVNVGYANVSVAGHAVTDSVRVDEMRAGGARDPRYHTLSDHYAVKAKLEFGETSVNSA